VPRRFNQATLASLREMPSEDALALLTVYYKADPAYAPIKDSRSHRWHVTTASGDFEILTTGPHKWYDTRAQKGGGGAIDLAMHLRQLSFVDAVKFLTECERPRG
jgi:hypothetical protein